MFSIGLNAYPATAIPNMNNQRYAPYQFTLSEQSWFVSIALLMSIPGSIFSGILMDKYGRKLALLIISVVTAIGFVIITAAQTVDVALVGRAVVGLTCTCATPIAFVYTSEIVPPKIRGHLVSFMELSLNGGILTAYIIGTYIPWNWIANVCSAINCAATCLLVIIPETPRWLLLKGHKEEAMESLNWLRVSETESEKEMLEILESLKSEKKPTPWMHYFRSPLLKSTFTSLMLFIVTQLSGLNCIRGYTVNIFQMSGSDLDANTETIIVGATAVLGSILCAIFADVFERKTLFVMSLFVTATGIATIGSYVQFVYLKELFWLPLVGLVMAMLGFALGGAGMSSIITCEMFSTQARGRALSIAYCVNSFSSFSATYFFLFALTELGEATVFWFFVGVCLFGFVIAFFMIPNTKGLSMEEIQKRNKEITVPD